MGTFLPSLGNFNINHRHWANDKDEEGTWHHQERHKGEFSRSVQLEQFLDPSKIKASMKEGVLHIKLPKEEDQVTAKIPIASQEVAPDLIKKS